MSSNSYSEESVISAMDDKFGPNGYTSGERDTVTYGVMSPCRVWMELYRSRIYYFIQKSSNSL